jgi:hypothetical protein
MYSEVEDGYIWPFFINAKVNIININSQHREIF